MYILTNCRIDTLLILDITMHVDIRGDLGFRDKRDQFQEAATRKHFITRQTFMYIFKKVKTTLYILIQECMSAIAQLQSHRHLEEAISIDRIVRELKEEVTSPILLYKPQGEVDPEYPMLLQDTFLLVIMTSFQASLFDNFSRRIVCLDSTHKTNQHRFKLLIAIVPDEYRNGNSDVYMHTYVYMYIECGISILPGIL